MEKYVSFIDRGGYCATLTSEQLNKYPDSFLTSMVRSTSRADYDTVIKAYRVPFLGVTLSLIEKFYKTDSWECPYVKGNQLSIENVEGGFVDSCKYLGLPDGPTDDPDYIDPTVEGDLDDEEYEEMLQQLQAETDYYCDMYDELEQGLHSYDIDDYDYPGAIPDLDQGYSDDDDFQFDHNNYLGFSDD